MYSIVLEDESDWLLFETTPRNAGTRLLSLCVAVGSHLCRVMHKEAYFVASKKGFSVDSEVVQGSLVACGEAIRSASESTVCALGCVEQRNRIQQSLLFTWSPVGQRP